MNEFLEELANILDVDAVSADSALEEFEEWDSLAVLSVIAMLDSKFQVNLSAGAIKAAQTPEGIFCLVQQAKQ